MLKRGWKTRWIKALRSGRYKQARSLLCEKKNGRAVGYCCLGVLARIEGAKFTDFGDVVVGKKSVKKVSAQYLEEDWCGLSDDTQTKLGNMNDRGSNFKEIAGWIKKNIKVKK